MGDEGGAEFSRYAGDPVGFVREVLGGRPWAKQVEILEALRDHPRVTVRACHGVGKSWVAAACVNWYLHAFHPAVVLTTAPTHRQVKQVLWREIRRQRERASVRLHHSLPGECRETSIKVDTETFALGLSTNEPERFQGFHALNILVVVDEASGVPEPIFEAIDGVLTTQNARLLLIGNPTQVSGTFHRSHHSPAGWHTIHISAFDSPNLRGDAERHGLAGEDLARLVTPRWVEERRREWGEDSPIYEIRVLGQFPTQGTDTLIPLAWIERAAGRCSGVQVFTCSGATEDEIHVCDALPEHLNTRTPEHPSLVGPVEIGVDVARFGDCESVAYVRRGPVVVAGEVWNGRDLMETAGRVAALIREWRPTAVKVDAIGLGAGVVDRLREQGFREVVAVNVAGRAANPERYASLRDEIYFALRDRFRSGDVALPAVRGSAPDEGAAPGAGRPEAQLAAQLSSLKYGFTSGGQMKVESKDEMRRRGLASPDRADALALCFALTKTPPRAPVALARRREL